MILDDIIWVVAAIMVFFGWLILDSWVILRIQRFYEDSRKHGIINTLLGRPK